jgi:trans-aconitate methyltransferase
VTASSSTPGEWDAARYQDRHSFVWRYGADLLELLNPQPGERILDIGCGTGQLTAEIARSGAQVVGLDNSPDMLADARKNFPDLWFVLGNATGFVFEEPFDAVFSNAALHWVKDADRAVACIRRALRPGGRFVAEFGGKGNITTVQAALRAVLGPAADEQSPWYYPGIGEYASILERHGLEVRNASLFPRLTPLTGADGMDHWLRMFMPAYLHHLSPERANEIVHKLEEELRPALYRDGTWTLDYRRIRIVAIALS